jgi:hypothetical protein
MPSYGHSPYPRMALEQNVSAASYVVPSHPVDLSNMCGRNCLVAASTIIVW